jgi:NAD-dependent deacetylase
MDETYKLLKKELPPKCSCGGNLKPGTVLFGEPLPQVALDMALLASKNCDLFLVLGSSLVVYPAASMPMIAKKSGAALVIVNIDPTPMDDIADLVFRESSSKVLSTLISGH